MGWNNSRKTFPSRGLRKERDLIYEAIISGSCVMCGKTLERKRYKNGRFEGLKQFQKRKTCGFYIGKDGKMLKTNCFKDYFLGERNMNYKGIMHIPCSVCGKQGLSYKNAGEEYYMCKKCYLKTRIPYNKLTNLKPLICTGCGVEIPPRWKSGKVRHKRKGSNNIYCNKTCANRDMWLRRKKKV